ncbi:hypothetical protein HDU97_001772 [Phlyctochytrium planicorne]|nr:hypothetical protein HDU97_001772 [Phlyctochytrium planicorne]
MKEDLLNRVAAKHEKNPTFSFPLHDDSSMATGEPPDETTLAAGIEAMTSAIASIPERYFKYNAVLKAKVTSVLSEVERLMNGLNDEKAGKSQDQRKGSGRGGGRGGKMRDDRSESEFGGKRRRPESEAIRRALILGRALTLLKEVWMSAWERRAPLSRHYHVSDLRSVDSLHHAEHVLHRFHLWRRVTDRISNPHDMPNRPLFMRSRSYSPNRGHVDIVHPQNQGYLFQALMHPSKLVRKVPYNPAHVYLAASPRSRSPERNSVRFTSIVKDVRMHFMDAVLRERIFHDSELEDVLQDVISACKECWYEMEGAVEGLEEGEGEKEMWQRVGDTVRREFSINGRGTSRFLKLQDSRNKMLPHSYGDTRVWDDDDIRQLRKQKGK